VGVKKRNIKGQRQNAYRPADIRRAALKGTFLNIIINLEKSRMKTSGKKRTAKG